MLDHVEWLDMIGRLPTECDSKKEEWGRGHDSKSVGSDIFRIMLMVKYRWPLTNCVHVECLVLIEFLGCCAGFPRESRRVPGDMSEEYARQSIPWPSPYAGRFAVRALQQLAAHTSGWCSFCPRFLTTLLQETGLATWQDGFEWLSSCQHGNLHFEKIYEPNWGLKRVT